MTRKMMMIKKTLLMVLMLTFGTTVSWGQTPDYSGTYYIGSKAFIEGSSSSNFYLCPTIGWCYYVYNGETSVEAEKNNFTGTDNGQPFLTTDKTFNSIDRTEWTLEKHLTENYYYIKHTIDDKYMVFNGQIYSTTDANCMRVHLETMTTPDDNTLFAVTPHNGYFVISPKNEPNQYLQVIGDNVDSFVGGEGVTGGPTNFENIKGIIGITDDIDNANAAFYLDDIIERPTISYNTNNNIEITTTVLRPTIYYTLDGSTPTVKKGIQYNVPFEVADNVTTIKAIVVDQIGKVSNVTTFIPQVLLGSTHIRLIQSQANNGYYYMLPGPGDAVNTLSLYRVSMQWHFLNAGVEGDEQYYYMVNHSGDYLCWNETSLQLTSFDNTATDQFKFRLVSCTEAGVYNLVPHGLTTGNMYLLKDNASTESFTLGSDATDAKAQWKFVKTDEFDSSIPFKLSNSNESYFYRLGNNSNYIVPNETALTTTTSPDNNASWFIEYVLEIPDPENPPAEDAPSYYYIRNAITNDYLYFNKTNVSAESSFEMRSSIDDADDKDRFQYTWARATDADKYYLIPKKLFSSMLGTGNYTSLSLSGGMLGTASGRGTSTIAWTIAEADGFCLDPELTMDADGYVMMTCKTNGSEIFYTTYGDYTDETGEDPSTNPNVPVESGKRPEAPTKLYATNFLLGLDATQVRAQAVLKNDHSKKSAVKIINLLVCPNVKVEDTDYHDAQGSVTIPKVKIGTVGEGDDEHDVYADIYYTIDGTDPRTKLVETTSHAIEPEIIFDYNSKTKIRAVAAKNGYRASESLYVMDVVYMPTVTLDKSDYTYTYSAIIEGGKIVSQEIKPIITKVEVNVGEGTEEIPLADINTDNIQYKDNKESGPASIIVYARNKQYFEDNNKTCYKLYGITNFTIKKAPITTVTLKEGEEFMYNHTSQSPTIKSVIAECGNENLNIINFPDYYTVTGNVQISAGVHTIVVSAKDDTNFSDKNPNTDPVEKATTTFTIKRKPLTHEDVKITIEKVEKTGGGYDYVPTLKDGSFTMKKGRDYEYELDTDNGIIFTFRGLANGNYGETDENTSLEKERVLEFIDLPFYRTANRDVEYAAVYVNTSDDLITPYGMTAYIVTDKTTKNTVAVEKINYIPKDVPVLLLTGKKADGFGKGIFQPTIEEPEYTDAQLNVIKTKNKLVRNASLIDVTTAQYYLFHEGEFVLNAAGQLPVGKIYLDLVSSSGNAPRLFIDGSQTTDIGEIIQGSEFVVNGRSEHWYTLDGRRLNGKPTKKGLYINNGNKVVIK